MQRLYVAQLPPMGQDLRLEKEQAHYLLHVLRLQPGEAVLLFDGKNGEGLARCQQADKKSLILRLEAQTRPQPSAAAPLIYCFAPLKQARLDYMVQKAVEMGASLLQPVLTQHTQVSRLNMARAEANIIEAAEQCGLLRLPALAAPLRLPALLAGWAEIYGRQARLIFCDEGEIADESAANAPGQNPLPALLRLKAEQQAAAKTAAGGAAEAAAGSAALPPPEPKPAQGLKPALGLLIGPEGGFSEAERKQLKACDFVCPVPLGPRIMRADTAAVAALAVVQSVLGDW